jgi:hypothetical protein
VTLIEALKSGKRFRRKGEDYWYGCVSFREGHPDTAALLVRDGGGYDRCVTYFDLVEAEWEVQEPEVTITRAHLEHAIYNAWEREDLDEICHERYVGFLYSVRKSLGLEY